MPDSIQKPIFSNYRVILTNITLILISMCVALIAGEVLYRLKLHFVNNAFEAKSEFRAGSFVYGLYDEKHGVRYVPSKKFTLFNIKNGQVTWCPDAISISNKDGINGKTTIAEYEQADIKILAFGDSWTHWNQGGYTWPDFLEDFLSEKLNKNVKVLNFGRGGYGILQMFDLAADKVLELDPDLMLIAFFTGDLKRNRWWTKVRVIGGYERPLLSPSKSNFSLSIASDEYLVNPKVNLDWCQEMLGKDTQDPILSQVIEQYTTIKQTIDEKRGKNLIHSMDKSYLFYKIATGSAFGNRRPLLPKVTFKDFREDEQMMENVARIKETNTPFVMFHLPFRKEILNSKVNMPGIYEALLKSLEVVTGKNVVFLHEEIDKSSLPKKMDLMPHDGHPNFEALELYGKTISNYLVENGFVQTE